MDTVYLIHTHLLCFWAFNTFASRFAPWTLSLAIVTSVSSKMFSRRHSTNPHGIQDCSRAGPAPGHASGRAGV